MDQYLKKESQVKFQLPQGKNFIVWLSHDVDRVSKTFFQALYYTLTDFNSHHFQSIQGGKNPYWNFEKILEIENSYLVKSTFYFMHETMQANPLNPQSFVLAKGRYNLDDPKIAKIINTLSLSGWEIGLHGSYLSYNRPELMRKEKILLEKVSGITIEGIRQHYLNLSIPDTWKYQRSLGFRYDASFGYNNQIGYKNDLFFPFRPFNDDFIVFPITIMDKILFEKNNNVDKVWDKCLHIIDTAESQKGFLSLLWHQRVFNEIDFPHYLTIYKLLIEECQKRGALFCTGKDIFQYIQKS